MKKLIFLIVILALAAANAFAARIYPAEGRVVDEQGQAVEYATVVLLKGSDQVAGMATDDTGRFVLKVPWASIPCRYNTSGSTPSCGRCGSRRTTTWARS